MDNLEKSLQELLERAQEREKTSRRRAWIYTLIPLIVGTFFLLFTSWKVIQAQQELGLAQQEVGQANQTATQAQNTLEGVQSDLNSSQETLTPMVEDIATGTRELATSHAQIAAATRALATSQAQVAAATRALATTTRDLATAEVQVDARATQLTGLQTQVADYKRLADEAAGFQKYLYTGGMELVMKAMAGTPPGDLLIYILQLQNKGVPWNASGFSERQGFNSPSFAAYVLQKEGLLPVRINAPISQGDLMKILPPSPIKSDQGMLPASLQWGDLIYYPAGYCMFYYTGDDGNPFVIGMTPLGILALQPNFAQPVGYYRVFQP